MNKIINYDQAMEALKHISKHIISYEPVITNEDVIKKAKDVNEALNELTELAAFLGSCEQREIQLERKCGD